MNTQIAGSAWRVVVLGSAMLLCAGRLAAQPTAVGALTLQEAIGMALDRGPSTRSATRARDAARFRDASFNARLLPQMSITGEAPTYSRAIVPVVQPDGSTRFVAQQQRQSSLGLQVAQRLPFTGGDLFLSSGLTNVNVLGQQELRLWRSTPLQLGVRQQIFRLNTQAWDNKEQDVRADAAEQQFLEARESISQQTAALYFDLFAAQTALANAEANAGVNDTLFTLNKGRYEVGRIGENDLLQSELAVLRSQNAVQSARLDEQRAAAALRLQLGYPSTAPLTLRVSNEVPAITVDTAVAMREALANAAQLRDADLQMIQQNRRVAEARRNTGFGATVSASVGFNQTAENFNEAYRSPLQSQQFAVGVEMPLVQWGARRAQIQAAVADRERVETDVRVLRERRVLDARFAALELEQASRQLLTAAKADTVGSKRFEVARNRYAIGRIDISNLYIAQVEKDQALEAYVRALRGYWDAYYRVRRLTLYDFERGARIR
ncbi:MAG TPA: TolC family protein [Gemmatimonas sp.]|uniref:TolC family protein n=1 Tax=Gemmatimonas sp. TaxID=1962908 RepID=UPI002EDA26A7